MPGDIHSVGESRKNPGSRAIAHHRYSRRKRKERLNWISKLKIFSMNVNDSKIIP